MVWEGLWCSRGHRKMVQRGGWLEVGLVLPVDGDGTSSQCLAPKPSRVLIFPHLTTHSAVAPLGTAGAFIQNPTNKDAAVKKYLLEGRESWLSCGTNCHCGQRLRATPQDPKCHLSHNSNNLRWQWHSYVYGQEGETSDKEVVQFTHLETLAELEGSHVGALKT